MPLIWDDDRYGEPVNPDDYVLDITTDLGAYFYGLVLSDGSMRENERNSGAVSIELNKRDGHPLWYFDESAPWPSRLSFRSRLSPFDGTEHSTISWVCHTRTLREQLRAFGYPLHDKARRCAPPIVEYDERAFWRGYLDGDGSLGITAQGIPFVSLVTISPAIAEAWMDFIERVTAFRPRVNPNKRDNAWNIMVMREKGMRLVSEIYRPGLLAIPRKAKLASEIATCGWKNAPWRKKGEKK